MGWNDTSRIVNIVKWQSKIRIVIRKNESRYVLWPYIIPYYTLTFDCKFKNFQKQHIIYVSRYVSYRDDHIEIHIVSWEKHIVVPLSIRWCWSRLLALLQLHFHSQHNTLLQWIGQTTARRDEKHSIVRSWCPYIRGLMVVIKINAGPCSLKTPKLVA